MEDVTALINLIVIQHLRKNKRKSAGEEVKKEKGKEEPIAIVRNNAGKFIAYIYEEDKEFYDIDIEMLDYYVERLNKGEKHGKRETDYQK